MILFYSFKLIIIINDCFMIIFVKIKIAFVLGYGSIVIVIKRIAFYGHETPVLIHGCVSSFFSISFIIKLLEGIQYV